MRYFCALLVILKTVSSEGQMETDFSAPSDLKDQVRVFDSKNILFFNIGFNAYFVFLNMKLNWYQAYEHCRALGMQLVSPSTSAINTRLKELLRAHNSTKDEFHYWISLNDLGQPNKFMWMSTGKFPAYTDWWISPPPDRLTNCFSDRCMDFHNIASPAGGWMDHSCWHGFSFICEK